MYERNYWFNFVKDQIGYFIEGTGLKENNERGSRSWLLSKIWRDGKKI